MRRSMIALVMLLVLASACAEAGTDTLQAWRKRFDGAGLSVGINPLNANTVIAEEVGGALSVSYDRGASWQPWATPGTSLIRQIVIHPADTNVVLVASSGPALLRTTNGGLSWEPVLLNFGIDGESVTLDPVHPDTIFAGDFPSGKVYRSLDRGATWDLMGVTGTPGAANLCTIAIRPDSTNVLYAGSGGGRISKSTDFGATWRVVKASTAAPNVFQETPRIVVSAVSPLIAYATTYGTVDATLDVWKTTDGGESWERTAMQGIPNWSLELDPADANIVYAGTFYDAEASVYKTTDGGASWTRLSLGFPPGAYMWNMKIHPLDPHVIWMGVTNGAFGPLGLYRLLTTRTLLEGALVDGATSDTLTNGTVWQLSTGESASITPDGRTFRFGYFEGDPSLSTTLVAAAYPYVVEQFPAVFVADSTVRAELALTRLSQHTLGGHVLDSATGAPVRAALELTVHRSIGDTVLTDSSDETGAYAFGGLYATAPPVNGYGLLRVDVPPPYATRTVTTVSIDSEDVTLDLPLRAADVFLVAAADSGTYVAYFQTALDDLGVTYNTWEVPRRGPAPLGRGKEFGFRTVIAYSGNSAAPLDASVLDSLQSCLDGGANLFLTGQNFVEQNAGANLFASTLGVAWAGNTGLSFNQGVNGDILSGFTCFTTGSSANNQTSRDSLRALRPGVVRILDYGTNTGRAAAFRVDSAGLAGAKAVVLGFGFEAIHTPAKRQALMGSILNYFRGLTAVEPTPGETLPSLFALAQNYPNPFNPTTTIAFSLPRAALVRLAVYDLNGRRVATLLDASVSAGSYEVPWRADVASGVYYYRLEAVAPEGGASLFSATRKLLVLK